MACLVQYSARMSEIASDAAKSHAVAVWCDEEVRFIKRRST